MDPELTVHTLLRIPDAHCLLGDSARPAWVAEALQRAPWVVMRRSRAVAAALPVGVRGGLRQERWAAWLPAGAILERVAPQLLARRRAWLSAPRRDSIAAIGVLDAVAGIMTAHGLEGCWGPAGSVGFELASGAPSAHPGSDLDLCVRLPALPPVALSSSLHGQLSALEVRCDVLLETPSGALALAEHTRQPGSYVLRTLDGPRLCHQEHRVCGVDGGG